MTRGVRFFLAGSFVLVALSGCGRGWLQFAEREPWRRDAEVACMKSGAVKENAGIARVEPISGPGVCGAEYPLKVVALGDSNRLGFADDLRPPGAIPGSSANLPRWPVAQPAAALPQGAPRHAPPSPPDGTPISLTAPGVGPTIDDGIVENDAVLANEIARGRPPPPREDISREPAPSSFERPPPRLGPARHGAPAPVTIQPTATLACPIVSALDRWIADAVQPAAMRWFGAPVAEIKQISAYSCRGMNGDRSSRISEHAFGNALDIAAFTLADGRRISVKNGWRGLPEEQGFLRDVQAAACEQFNTVLAPGSNIYHYDHIHVDLMRRSSRRSICQPAAASGEEVAARASNGRYAARDPSITGSLKALGKKIVAPFKRPSKVDDKASDDDWIEDESNIHE
jgi:hypothetical protein